MELLAVLPGNDDRSDQVHWGLLPEKRPEKVIKKTQTNSICKTKNVINH